LATKRQTASGIARIHAMSLDTEYLEWNMDLHAMRREPYSNDMLVFLSLSLLPSCFFYAMPIRLIRWSCQAGGTFLRAWSLS